MAKLFVVTFTILSTCCATVCHALVDNATDHLPQPQSEMSVNHNPLSGQSGGDITLGRSQHNQNSALLSFAVDLVVSVACHTGASHGLAPTAAPSMRTRVNVTTVFTTAPGRKLVGGENQRHSRTLCSCTVAHLRYLDVDIFIGTLPKRSSWTTGAKQKNWSGLEGETTFPWTDFKWWPPVTEKSMAKERSRV